MTKRTHAAHQLAAYFEDKGHILTPFEYKKEKDTPIRFAAVKKVFGSWNRMEKIVRGLDIRNKLRAEQEPTTDIDEVLRRNAGAEAAYAEKMKAASEDLEAKTAREKAAHDYIEADKLRAATAEGAAENKERKGGTTSQDAKAAQEAVQRAVAEEHAMLAQTGAGAALGKHLLGGVEDNDEKNRVIAEQNAMTERKKLMAATPEGAAEAKLMEDDTDGQLTREAEARIRAELRPYVPPVTADTAKQAVSEGQAKVRDEVRKVVKEAHGDEDVLTDSVFRASMARARAATDLDAPVLATDIPEDIMRTMPPASQLPEAGFEGSPTEIKDKKGNVVANIEDDEENVPDEAGQEKRTESAKKAEKLSAGEKEANKDNPHAPPATRNPDPNVAKTAKDSKTAGKK